MQQRMTCQCCWRLIMAKNGVIAHHGYQRPSEGWQTSSCYGARHLPFEASRDTLGLLITTLENRLLREEQHLVDTMADKTTIRVSWKARTWPHQETKHVDVTVDTFEAVKKENETQFIRRSYYSWSGLKK